MVTKAQGTKRKRAQQLTAPGGGPLYPTDRWQKEMQQLHDDEPKLGITVLEDDGYYCRFRCQGTTYSVVWRERHPLDPPLMYREDVDNECMVPITPQNYRYSPASSVLSLVADIIFPTQDGQKL